MKNKFIIFLIFCFSIFISCSNYNITDRVDNEIIIPKKIDKIVSLSPAITEILIDLNLANNIVACDIYSKNILIKYNKYINVNNIDYSSPDYEKIISINPDILFVNSLTLFYGSNAIEHIKNIGICVIVIPSSDSIIDIEKDILFISSILGKKEYGEKIVNDMNTNIEKIKLISNNIKHKKKIYFEIDFSPNFYSFGKNVFLDEMINIIGAENIFKNENSWISISEENILSHNPDVILTSVDYIDDPVKEILNRKAWQNINAIKNKEVYYISCSSLANHNIINSLFEMYNYVYNDFK